MRCKMSYLIHNKISLSCFTEPKLRFLIVAHFSQFSVKTTGNRHSLGNGCQPIIALLQLVLLSACLHIQKN